MLYSSYEHLSRNSFIFGGSACLQSPSHPEKQLRVHFLLPRNTSTSGGCCHNNVSLTFSSFLEKGDFNEIQHSATAFCIICYHQRFHSLYVSHTKQIAFTGSQLNSTPGFKTLTIFPGVPERPFVDSVCFYYERVDKTPRT